MRGGRGRGRGRGRGGASNVPSGYDMVRAALAGGDRDDAGSAFAPMKRERPAPVFPSCRIQTWAWSEREAAYEEFLLARCAAVEDALFASPFNLDAPLRMDGGSEAMLDAPVGSKAFITRTNARLRSHIEDTLHSGLLPKELVAAPTASRTRRKPRDVDAIDVSAVLARAREAAAAGDDDEEEEEEEEALEDEEEDEDEEDVNDYVIGDEDDDDDRDDGGGDGDM